MAYTDSDLHQLLRQPTISYWLYGEVREPDSLRAQSQRRDVTSTAEIINIACGETTQGFHLNATTCIPTWVSILLLFGRKGIAKPNSNKAPAHPEPLPIRQSTGSSLPLNAWNCTQFQSGRPPVLWTLQYQIWGRQQNLISSTFGWKNGGLG